MKDLTIFIITCGEGSLDECMGSIESQHVGSKSRPNVEVIKDVYPVSEAFNEMHKRSQTPYFIQVDADIILNKDAIDKLYQAMKKSNFLVYATVGQLYEEGFGLGGSVRCWRRCRKLPRTRPTVSSTGSGRRSSKGSTTKHSIVCLGFPKTWSTVLNGGSDWT